MKRLLSVLLAVLLTLALAGCGGKDSGDSGAGSGGSGDNVGSGNGDVYAEDGWAEGRMGDTMHAYWFNYTVNSAYTCGELIYFFEYACGLSGYLLGVNPFDQPGVEAYKKNMFALLGKPGYEAQKAELEAKLGK